MSLEAFAAAEKMAEASDTVETEKVSMEAFEKSASFLDQENESFGSNSEMDADTSEHIGEGLNEASENRESLLEQENSKFGSEMGNVDSREKDLTEGLDKLVQEYFDDLKSKSEYPDTIPDKPFDSKELKALSPEENSKMRDEFDDNKAMLKKEWEDANGQAWPKYDHDIYSANGKLIRKAGSDYDAHHVQPLGMGGKNEASNLTPLSAEVHYDKQGVHAPDSPYNRLNQELGGRE